MIVKIAVLLFFLRSAWGNTRTCFCSWKIGSKTGNAPDTRYSGWVVTCGYVERRCPGDCLRQVKRYLRYPDSTYAGKVGVCTRHGPTTKHGVGVYAGTVVSNCKSLRYQEIVPPGRICCYSRKCRHLRLVYRQNNRQHSIGITLRDPYIKPYYSCLDKHTTLCENDLRSSLRSSYFRSTTVNWYSGQRVCNVLKKKIPYPGVRIEVDYDIGDKSDHFYPVPGGNVCCGCLCKLRATYQGSPVTIPATLQQSAQTRYFSCGIQARQCKDYCRGVIGKVLNKNKSKLTSLNIEAAYKACELINKTKKDPPGVVLYSVYDVGGGPVYDKLGDTCCVKVPKLLQDLYNLPPIIANVNC